MCTNTKIWKYDSAFFFPGSNFLRLQITTQAKKIQITRAKSWEAVNLNATSMCMASSRSLVHLILFVQLGYAVVLFIINTKAAHFAAMISGWEFERKWFHAIFSPPTTFHPFNAWRTVEKERFIKITTQYIFFTFFVLGILTGDVFTKWNVNEVFRW